MLPLELWSIIFYYLSGSDVESFIITCKYIYQMLKSLALVREVTKREILKLDGNVLLFKQRPSFEKCVDIYRNKQYLVSTIFSEYTGHRVGFGHYPYYYSDVYDNYIYTDVVTYFRVLVARGVERDVAKSLALGRFRRYSTSCKSLFGNMKVYAFLYSHSILLSIEPGPIPFAEVKPIIYYENNMEIVSVYWKQMLKMCRNDCYVAFDYSCAQQRESIVKLCERNDILRKKISEKLLEIFKDF